MVAFDKSRDMSQNDTHSNITKRIFNGLLLLLYCLLIYRKGMLHVKI